jgi:hypothetical protein
MDYDPYTGDLWYLENDRYNGGEIIMLDSTLTDKIKQIDWFDVTPSDTFFCIDKKYKNDPKLKGEVNTQLNSLLFFDSLALGKKYMNNLLVTSVPNQIFEFDLPRYRNNIDYSGDSSILTDTYYGKYLFADGFVGLTNIQVNPFDGTLYIIDTEPIDGKGTVYKVEQEKKSETWFLP